MISKESLIAAFELKQTDRLPVTTHHVAVHIQSFSQLITSSRR